MRDFRKYMRCKILRRRRQMCGRMCTIQSRKTFIISSVCLSGLIPKTGEHISMLFLLEDRSFCRIERGCRYSDQNLRRTHHRHECESCFGTRCTSYSNRLLSISMLRLILQEKCRERKKYRLRRSTTLSLHNYS